MTAVFEKPEASAEDIECLSVWVECGGLSVLRNVYPAIGFSIQAIVDALKVDEHFLNVFSESGILTVEKGGRLILLASWSTDTDEGVMDLGAISECVVQFIDGSEEKIPV